ncbi:Intu_longin_3 domain-containing protein [Sergentomyia squamirostris]
MSKEVIIVFVYDKEKCQDEADDPISAVVYFHPTWVSDTQKLTLCGQLMGVSHFLELNFSQPKLISLENGKFVLNDFGRFLLYIGTDRNVSNAILEYRANLLTSLVKLFHRDIQNIFDQTSSGQYRNFSTKLYHILESYISTIQYNGSLFQNVPTLKLPNSASNIFLEAMQTLQSCQQTRGVLGGLILYHSKIIATQLSPALSKRLVLTDPYRVKSIAEGISVGFHVPVGVQLLVVYVTLNEYMRLKQDATRAQTSFTNNQSASGNIFPLPVKRKMMRDKSLIFSNIPEEEVLATGVEEIPPRPVKSRPTHLPLRFKNVSGKEIAESGINSINFDDNDSFPQFIGKTSVCSTPMTENKVLMGNVMPICVNKTLDASLDEKKTEEEEEEKKLNQEVIRPESTAKKHKRRFSFRPLHQGLTRVGKSLIQGSVNAMEKDVNVGQRCQTIADPNYPVFNDDGIPISKSLYDSCCSGEDQSIETDEVGMEVVEDLKIEGFEDEASMQSTPQLEKIEPPADLAEKRKSLSLPLKSLSMESTNSGSDAEMSAKQKIKLTGGIPLTPLMSKLSILALNDERSSGFSSWDTTPGHIETPIDINKSLFRRRSSAARIEEPELEGETSSQKVEMFLCGHQNMTMILLMEENSAAKQEVVHAMWEICIARLTKIENALHKILNVNVDGLTDKSDTNYSFICLDPKWDIIHRGGPWTTEELLILEDMHMDFKVNPTFTESIIRCEESIVYGYQCGDTQIFYKQPVHSHRGLPPPADAMGNVSLIAKRRLERDHSVILL